jgi:hypothetical protein
MAADATLKEPWPADDKGIGASRPANTTLGDVMPLTDESSHVR